MPRYKQDELFATISGGADARVFLGWERPLVAAAAAHLCREWNGGLLDLSSKMVIVPTRHAGRRLREALAAHAASRNAAVLPPMTVPPDFLVNPERRGPQVVPPASAIETLIAWISVLQATDLDACRHVFPVDPVERGFSWAIQSANQFERLRASLIDAGHTIQTAVSRFGKILDEPERWKELAALERKMAAILKRSKRIDRPVARKMAADSATLPEGIDTIVVLATPDPGDLAITALENLSAKARTEVVVYAPEDLSDLFDGWGRPLPVEWGNREIMIPDANRRIHLAANPKSQASKLADLLGEKPDPGSASVGVPDSEVARHLESTLGDRGWNVFNPDGVPFIHHELAHVLGILGDWLRTRSFQAFAALASNPDFLRSVGAKSGEDWSVSSVLARIDKLRDDHLPDTIDDLVDASRRANVDSNAARLIETAAGWLRRFDEAGQSGFGDCLLAFLGFLYGHREFRSDAPDDAAFSVIAGEISTALKSLEGTVFRMARCRLDPADALDLLLQALSELAFHREREADDFDLQGWLELLWDDAPHLVLTGCNDGFVPDTIVGDPFLPNQARVLLGLKDNERRFGRDAYLLTCLVASREHTGRVDFIVGKTSDKGDPLRPSRLLFRCAAEELPGRALHLFQGESSAAEEKPVPAWTLAWKLKPPPLPDNASIRSRLSITAFGAFLMCPFRFFLSHGLGMREIDAEKQEMTPMEFGNLCHHAFERLGRDEAMRDCEDENEVREFLLAAVEDYAERRYGRILTLPVRIQLEAARQRLARAAAVHAADRREGWRIEQVEWRFDEERSWEINGLQITGTIDRIDRHTRTNARRILDYKTSSKATSPEEAHLLFLKRNETPDDFRPWLLFPGPDGRIMRWINLQLPLYVLALDRSNDDTQISAGYFNLPRSVGDTAITTWSGLSGELLEQALACAEAAVEDIRAEVFWPPADRPRFDDFKRLFFGDVAASVEVFGSGGG